MVLNHAPNHAQSIPSPQNPVKATGNAKALMAGTHAAGATLFPIVSMIMMVALNRREGIDQMSGIK